MPINYLAQGLDNGFRTGADAYQQSLRRQFELDQDLARGKRDRDMQDARIIAQAKEAFDDRTFRSGESKLGREASVEAQNKNLLFDANKFNQGQQFTRTENDLNRALQEMLHKNQAALDQARLDQAEKQFGQTLSQRQQEFGTNAGLNARKIDAANDPLSLKNQTAAANLRRLNLDYPPESTTVASTTPSKLPVLTVEQARLAKPGTKYMTTDGRAMTR